MRDMRISGSYIGLAAAYADQIYESLAPQVKGLILNCEGHKDSAESLSWFTKIVNYLYQTPRFQLYTGNIFNAAHEVSEKFAVVDLDMMKCLQTNKAPAQKRIEPIIQLLNNCTANKFILLLWSCYGRAITEQAYDEQVRNIVVRSLAQNWRIVTHQPFKYCDNHIPIKVELFALTKRAQPKPKRKEIK